MSGSVGPFAAVGDPRRSRGIRHQVRAILAIAAVAVVCWERSFAAIGEWADDAPQSVLEVLVPAGTGCTAVWAPYEATMRRAIQAFDAELLHAVICAWLAQQAATKPGGARQVAVPLDGKVMRGAWGQTARRCGIQRTHVELYIRGLEVRGLMDSFVNTMMHALRGYFRRLEVDLGQHCETLIGKVLADRIDSR